jgi:hypothetical protein
MEVDMDSNSFHARRDIYRKLLANELVSGKPALSLKFHIAEPDLGSLKLVIGSRKHHIGNVPV